MESPVRFPHQFKKKVDPPQDALFGTLQGILSVELTGDLDTENEMGNL